MSLWSVKIHATILIVDDHWCKNACEKNYLAIVLQINKNLKKGHEISFHRWNYMFIIV